MRKLKVEELGRADVASFQKMDKIPLIAVLDNIRSFHNIGAFFRTADAFRLKAIYLVGISPRPPHRDIEKTALGATDSVAWSYFESPEDCIAALKAENIGIAVIEQTDESTPFEQFQWEGSPLAVVFGHEVFGVSQPFLDAARHAFEIRQEGTKHSLNVSVCGGIVLHALFAQSRSTSSPGSREK
jgi:tRNA G18 (ribose-2'-O)-methylase SpoU